MPYYDFNIIHKLHFYPLVQSLIPEQDGRMRRKESFHNVTQQYDIILKQEITSLVHCIFTKDCSESNRHDHCPNDIIIRKDALP